MIHLFGKHFSKFPKKWTSKGKRRPNLVVQRYFFLFENVFFGWGRICYRRPLGVGLEQLNGLPNKEDLFGNGVWDVTGNSVCPQTPTAVAGSHGWGGGGHSGRGWHVVSHPCTCTTTMKLANQGPEKGGKLKKKKHIMMKCNRDMGTFIFHSCLSIRDDLLFWHCYISYQTLIFSQCLLKLS